MRNVVGDLSCHIIKQHSVIDMRQSAKSRFIQLIFVNFSFAVIGDFLRNEDSA